MTGEDSLVPEGWTPRLPVTSVFLAILLFWAAAWAINNTPSSWDFLIYLVPAILVIPRVRLLLFRHVLQFNLDDHSGITPRDIRLLLLMIGIAVYGFLGLTASFLVVGSAVNDPTMQPMAGVLSLVIMFVIAAVIVYGIRLARRLQPESA